jgi:hypothetical protein
MKKNINCAEAVDRMQNGVAWGMLICGLTYIVLLVEELTPAGTLNQVLDGISGLGVIITLIVTFLAMWPLIRMKLKGEFTLAKEPESFFSNAMLMSFKNGWIASMVTIILLLGVSTRLETLGLSHKFFFILLFAVSILSVSLSFFWQTRKDGLDDLEG